MSFTQADVQIAMRHFDWTEMNESDVGTPFAILLNSLPTVVLKTAEEITSESTWMVFEIKGRFFRKSGYYSSEDGTYWDGSIREVQGKEKLITVYEAI